MKILVNNDELTNYSLVVLEDELFWAVGSKRVFSEWANFESIGNTAEEKVRIPYFVQDLPLFW